MSVRDQLDQWVKRAQDEAVRVWEGGVGIGSKRARCTHSRVTALFQSKGCERVVAAVGVLDFKGLFA